MRRGRAVHFSYIFAVLLISLSCVSSTYAEGAISYDSSRTKQTQSQISFESLIYDLGEVAPGSKNNCEFKFTNTGKAVLNIKDIKNTCGCTVPDLEKKQYAPGESGTIKATITLGQTAGVTQKSLYVLTDDKNNPRIKLTIKAKVVQMVEMEPAELSLSLN